MIRENVLFKGVKLLLSVVYLSTLTYIVFFARRRQGITRRYLNLVPIERTVSQFHWIGSAQGGRYNFYTNFFGNILLFIPLPMIVMNYFRIDRWKPAVLTGFILSCIIEVLQYTFEIGFADIDDVILNTTGAFIGASIFRYLRRNNWVQFDW